MNKKKRAKKKEFKDQSRKNIINYLLPCLSVFLLVLFLILNLHSSQNISYLYEKLINSNKKATIEYLKKIKSLSIFQKELKKFTNIFGKSIVKEVFFDDQQRKIKIKKLEEVLKKNPQSRDVLISLAILYQEDGNDQLAKEYLKKAKEVDPILTIDIK